MPHFTLDGSGVLLTFGKYNGQYLHNLDNEEGVGWMLWVIEQHVDRNSFPPDLIVEIEEELKSRGIEFT